MLGLFGRHSSSTAARIFGAGMCSDRSSGTGTAVVPTAAAAVERVDGRSVDVQYMGLQSQSQHRRTRATKKLRVRAAYFSSTNEEREGRSTEAGV